MSNLRSVHDILTRSDVYMPVGIIQIKPSKYQCVCPWCAQDVGNPIKAKEYGELYEKCLEEMSTHMLIYSNKNVNVTPQNLKIKAII
jgi:hypothetical protein